MGSDQKKHPNGTGFDLVCFQTTQSSSLTASTHPIHPTRRKNINHTLMSRLRVGIAHLKSIEILSKSEVHELFAPLKAVSSSLAKAVGSHCVDGHELIKPLPSTFVYSEQSSQEGLKSLLEQGEGVYCLTKTQLDKIFGSSDETIDIDHKLLLASSQLSTTPELPITSHQVSPQSPSHPNSAISFPEPPSPVSISSLLPSIKETALSNNTVLTAPPPLLALQKDARVLPEDGRRFFEACGEPSSSSEGMSVLSDLIREKGGTYFAKMVHPTHGGTPLHVAAGVGNAEVCEWLLDHCDVNARSFNGSTPLHWACGSGSLDVTHLLLANNADTEIVTYTWTRETFGKDSGQTAAFWAAESGYWKCVEAILNLRPMAATEVDERGAGLVDVAVKGLQFGVKKHVDAFLEGDGVFFLRVKEEQVVSKVL